MFVNWCLALGTCSRTMIIGKSERGGHPVERRMMRQWMLRITAFAERLLEGLERIDWPQATKDRQREWIGRSEGAELEFPVAGTEHVLRVFTTRPDTIFGATYMVVAPSIDRRSISTPDSAPPWSRTSSAASRSELDRQLRDKTSVDTGARARNPATNETIPIWIADYVIYGCGTGAIMAVPAHDERDHEFMKRMGLPIVEVISGGNVQEAPYVGTASW
jgi:leucyl-tRNA synthetase